MTAAGMTHNSKRPTPVQQMRGAADYQGVDMDNSNNAPQDATLAARVAALHAGMHQCVGGDWWTDDTSYRGSIATVGPCPTLALLDAPEPDTRAEGVDSIMGAALDRITQRHAIPTIPQAEAWDEGWEPVWTTEPRTTRPAPAVAEGTDARLSDDERRVLERIEDTGDTQGLAWRVQQMLAARLAQRAPRAEDVDDPNHPESVDCDGYPLSGRERCGRTAHRPYAQRDATPDDA